MGRQQPPWWTANSGPIRVLAWATSVLLVLGVWHEADHPPVTPRDQGVVETQALNLWRLPTPSLIWADQGGFTNTPTKGCS